MSNHNSLASPFQDFSSLSLSIHDNRWVRTLCFLWHEIEKGWENYQSIFGSTLYKTSTACVDSTRKFSIQRCLEIMQISSVKRSIKKISIIFFYINKQFRCWSYQSCSVAYAWGAERSHSNFVTSKNVEKKKKINKNCSTYLLSVSLQENKF